MAFRYVKYTTCKGFKVGDFEITTKINAIYNSAIDRSRKNVASITSARVSIRRAHKNLFDLLRANDWKFFLTLTFGFDGMGADEKCRRAFSSWAKYVRSALPDMYYLAVPEYHKKGDLHYHLVVGGVTADQLGLVYSGRVLHRGKAWRERDFIKRGFVVDTLTGEGAKVYNVTSWSSLGFSTATEVRNTDAVARYVGKYLTKVDIDPRFYNKRRFHTSHNITKPTVLRGKEFLEFRGSLHDQLEDYGLQVSYAVDKVAYTKYDMPKEELLRLRLQGKMPMPRHLR